MDMSLRYQGKTLHTKEKFEHCVRNGFGRDLEMFLDAITRCQPAQIVVHTDSTYLVGGFERISRYRENGWKNSKGEEMKHLKTSGNGSQNNLDKEILFETGRTQIYPVVKKRDKEAQRCGKNKPRSWTRW